MQETVEIDALTVYNFRDMVRCKTVQRGDLKYQIAEQKKLNDQVDAEIENKEQYLQQLRQKKQQKQDLAERLKAARQLQEEIDQLRHTYATLEQCKAATKELEDVRRRVSELHGRLSCILNVGFNSPDMRKSSCFVQITVASCIFTLGVA